MSSPVYSSITTGGLFYLVSRRIRDQIAAGTASSVNSSLIAATAGAGLERFHVDADPRVLNKLVTIWEGPQIGDTARVSSFTTATKAIVPLPAFGGNLSASSKYVIHNIHFLEYLEAFKEAQRLLTYDSSLKRGIMAETGSLRHIMIGNALANPVFDLYTTSNVPNAWTEANSTLTQETTITYGGARRSLKVVTDGSNVANLTQSLLSVGRYKDLATLRCWAWVYCTTASEVFLRITDGGTAGNSDLHGGTGWEKLEVDYEVTDDISQLTASIRTTNTGAVTFYVQVVWVPLSPRHDHRYDLDAAINLAFLKPTLRVSTRPFGDAGTTGVNDFDAVIPGGAWEIMHDTTRQIRLKIGGRWNGHILEFSGFKAHPALTLVNSTWTGSIPAMVDMASAIMRDGRVARGTVISVESAKILALKDYGVKVPNVKPVEFVI